MRPVVNQIEGGGYDHGSIVAIHGSREEDTKHVSATGWFSQVLLWSAMLTRSWQLCTHVHYR